MDFRKKVYNYIEENELLDGVDTCIVGLSGGADSVALFVVLSEYAKEHGIEVIAAHVNHNMRDTAMRDQSFVEEFCRSCGTALKVRSVDVIKYAGEKGLSTEEAGRILRYEFFDELARESKSDNVRIAVAHHEGDLAETVLFNMTRGSGIRGLRGIVSASGNIIRPLLGVTKEEIKEFLSDSNIKWMEDETNACEDYSRNRIRNSVLPELNTINSEAAAHIATLAKEAGEIEELLDDIVGEAAAKYTKEDGGILIGADLLKERSIIANRVILGALRRTAGRMKDIGRIQVDAVRDLFESTVGSERSFIYGLRAVRTYEGVRICLADSGEADGKCSDESIEITIGEPFTVDGKVFETSLKEDFELKNIPVKRYTKWFDCDKIKNRLEVRHRRVGDYFIADNKGSRKMLSDYFKDEKIDSLRRDDIWVIADGSHILWVIGYRIGEYYKVTDKTTKVIEIMTGEGD